MQLFRESLDYKHEPAERLAALHTIALIEEAELHDDAAAIDTYRSALEVDDEDAHALEALSRLYARTERWRDLADMTRRRAEQSALPEDEARFRIELAKLLLAKLGEPQAGIDELQAVVELVPPVAGAPGAEAVRLLEAAARRRPEHKARVVEHPAPDLRACGRLAAPRRGQRRAPRAGERRRRADRDPPRDRASCGRSAATIARRHSTPMRDGMDARPGGRRRARAARPPRRGDDDAGTSSRARTRRRLRKTDGLTKRELLAALAQLHDKRRDDPRRALDAWDRLFALDETELQPLEEMDALATLLSDWPTLVRVLDRKAELVPDDETRASTWRRVGEAKRDMLDDLPGAIDAYERALELEPASTFTLDSLIALARSRRTTRPARSISIAVASSCAARTTLGSSSSCSSRRRAGSRTI